MRHQMVNNQLICVCDESFCVFKSEMRTKAEIPSKIDSSIIINVYLRNIHPAPHVYQ